MIGDVAWTEGTNCEDLSCRVRNLIAELSASAIWNWSIFSKLFSWIFSQLPIFYWPPISIPIYQNLLTNIFVDIFTMYY